MLYGISETQGQPVTMQTQRGRTPEQNPAEAVEHIASAHQITTALRRKQLGQNVRTEQGLLQPR
jgi:hypothetical protein